jgi:hypothetical protein
MFDNFHYTAPDDPALFLHGWLVRVGTGAPGIRDTWSAAGVSFPADPDAQGGQVLQLEARTDGTKQGTTQAQLQTTASKFFTGTFAARIFFADAPSSGGDGDHINESFYAISADATPRNTRYSELDNEYMPNGGWGNPGPFLDTNAYYTSDWRKEANQRNRMSLHGWRTMVITAADGIVTFYVDDQKLFSASGKYFPREGMVVSFNTWFIDLPFTGARTWDMKVNWFYYNAHQAMSATDVNNAVSSYYSSGMSFIDTVPKS